MSKANKKKIDLKNDGTFNPKTITHNKNDFNPVFISNKTGDKVTNIVKRKSGS